MIRYRASWVLPIAAPPIRDGWVDIDAGRVAAVGSGGAAGHDLGSAALLPGLVNAHTHLELSYLRDTVPPSGEFVEWIRQVVGAQRRTDPHSPPVAAAIHAGIDECVRSGTVLVGDISNTLAAFDPLTRSPLGGVVFHELIRFSAPDPDAFVAEACERIEALGSHPRVRASLAAHAPYSVAPRLFGAIRRAMDRYPSAPFSVHLSESRDEVELIAKGTGAWKMFLEQVGAWDPQWIAQGGSPVAYLDACGFLDPRLLAVHGVQMTGDDLARIASAGATLVACPRSNARTGAGVPPVSAFYASGVRVAVGTDSLASTPDLNLFSELAALRALAPDVPAARLLASATREGARALGFDTDYGTIEPGKSGRLLAVSVPGSVTDVEEYLVGGIQPDDVRWIETE